MKTKCSCGKKSSRYCPALNSQICFICCGTKRNGPINCPNDCTHNPFNPELYQSHCFPLENKVQQRLIDLLQEWLTPAGFAMKMDRYMREFEEKEDSHLWEEHFIFRLLTIEEDDQGRRFEDYLEQTGFQGFSNDEWIIARGFVNATGGIFEITEIAENGRMSAVDAFFGDKYLIIDRSMAQQLSRFDKFIAIYFELPSYTRITGVTAIGIPRLVEKPFLSEVCYKL